jgi:2-keto-4-pentenoate hydratase
VTSPDQHALAVELREARLRRRPVGSVTRRHPGFTVEQALAVQRELRVMEIDAGATIVGHKIGATSKAIQEMFRIDHPDSGFLTDRMILASGAVLNSDEFIAPFVEGEVAFRLAEDLQGTQITASDVAEATSEILPALEVLDSRIANWDIRFEDTVADNASCGVVVLGNAAPFGVAELASQQMRLEVDGHVELGQGSAVLGHPAEAVALLVRMLATEGRGLLAGEIVLAGAWAAAIGLRSGSHAYAAFQDIGDVSLSMR